MHLHWQQVAALDGGPENVCLEIHLLLYIRGLNKGEHGGGGRTQSGGVLLLTGSNNL